ncbi:hypothetical protein [Paraburkholderia dipogonis]|uniref:hypothetical protein n=2 Tax=Paraburkholderia TaxID=1822464 RepID=UPI0038BA839F
MLSLHRARGGLVKSRTALANQIRGLLSEFGFVLPQGIRLLGQRAIEALSNREHELCEPFRTLIQLFVEHLRELGDKAAELEGRIHAMYMDIRSSCAIRRTCCSATRSITATISRPTWPRSMAADPDTQRW